ncbi:DUF4157 domain-containing protein [Spirulina major CS-329]|uniref:eCIS core domain-containing protein n=1 Tax=Spirulina TaxID=1154 RepID=UPI00232B837C|nr:MULTISPECIES: DUF4157 domain-containing protein [Spirulina]MDB9494819.1 DUF4157 domain-containing protein [Spirulina subsalsa CS-330]MDB9502928.1 DUF4157 domain-containing protein [Spirulina major CS-329]
MPKSTKASGHPKTEIPPHSRPFPKAQTPPTANVTESTAQAPPTALPIMPKLTVGAANDKYEQEADAVAAQVVQRLNAPPPPVQRDGDDPTPTIRRQTLRPQVTQAGGGISPDLEQSIQRERGNGQALNDKIRTPLESAFGADFSSVRIHTNTASDHLNQSVQAKAFTTGSDVFFRQGAYNPSSRGGQELLAHELTHVVQQSQGSIQRKPQTSSPHSALQIGQTNAPTIQRVLIGAQRFEKAVDTGGMFEKSSDTTREIASWLRDYHNTYPPKNEGDRNLLLGILDEIDEATQRWLTKHQGDTKSKTQKRRPVFEYLNHEIPKTVQELKDIDLTQVPDLDFGNSQAEQDRQHLKKKMEGDVGSCLSKAGWIIDAAVPTPGDAASLEIDLEAPLGSGGFIGFNLKLEGERAGDNKTVKVGMTFLCTGGGSLGAGKLKGKLGGYVESNGKDSANAMALISYGFYRRMQESQLVPREIPRYMWGGSTDTKGHKLAERWAAGVEMDILESEEELSVETGAVGAVEGEIGVAGVAKFGGEIAGKTGRKTDKASLQNLKLKKYREQQGQAALDADTMLKDPEQRAELKKALIAPPPSYRGETQKKSGEGTRNIKLTGKAETPIIGGEVAYERSYSSKGRQKVAGSTKRLAYSLDSSKLAGSAKLTLPLAVFGNGAHFAQMLIEWLGQAQSTSTALGAKGDQKAMSDAQVMGAAFEPIGSELTAFGAMAANIDPTKFELTGVPEDPTELGGKSEIALSIEGEAEWKAGQPKPSKTLKILMITTKGIESPVFKALIEKKKLLKKWEWPG